MGTLYRELNSEHKDFIKKQQLYFVATAPLEGRISLSPKGLNSFLVNDSSNCCFANLVGSGNETSAHLLENGRITIMFCSFEKSPLILRLYGEGSVVYPDHKNWKYYENLFPEVSGVRQFVSIKISSVQTSCGYGVPLFDFVGERKTLPKWIENKGPGGLQKYMDEKNKISMDGLSTGL